MTGNGTVPGTETDDLAGAAYAATATVDGRGIVTAWSEGAQLLLGYHPEEVLGRAAAELLAEEATEATRRPLTDRGWWSGTAVLRHRGGHRLDVGLLAHRKMADGGSMEWILAPNAPGSPRSDALVGWTFNQLPYALAIFDKGRRMVRANTVMERVLALAEDDMRELRAPDIVPGPEGEG